MTITSITPATPVDAGRSEPPQYGAWEAGATLGAFTGGISAIRHAAPVARHAKMRIAAPAAGAVAALGVATAESAAVRALAGGDASRERAIHAGVLGGGALGWLALGASSVVSRSPALSLARTGAAVLAASSAASLVTDGLHTSLDGRGLGAATAPAGMALAGGIGLALMHRPPASMATAVAKEAEYAAIMRSHGVGETHGQLRLPFEPERLLPTVPWNPEWTGQVGYRAAAEAVPAKVITHLLGREPGIRHMDPIRAIVPYEAAATPAERARIALEMLDDQHFLERGTVLVDNPAGGSVARPQVEAAELLTRGDLATVSVAFAKKPAIQSLDATSRAAALETQQLVLAGIRERIDALPPGAPRPKVVLLSNSLGNRGADDVFYEGGRSQRERYGIDRFVSFGVPSVAGTLAKVSDDLQRGIAREGAIRYASAEELARIPAAERHAAWQHVVTNYDDQVQVRARDVWMKPPVPARAEDPGIGPWIPLVSALRRVEDALQLGFPRPGVIADRAHMHTKVAPTAMREVLDVPPLTDEQFRRIEDFGRRSELARYGMGPHPVLDEPFPRLGDPA